MFSLFRARFKDHDYHHHHQHYHHNVYPIICRLIKSFNLKNEITEMVHLEPTNANKMCIQEYSAYFIHWTCKAKKTYKALYSS